jgi:hypothetical protein
MNLHSALQYVAFIIILTALSSRWEAISHESFLLSELPWIAYSDPPPPSRLTSPCTLLRG